MDTMLDMQNRLKLGEVFSVNNCKLYREGKRYILSQAGENPAYFRSLDEAIIALLSTIGKFEESS